MQDQMTKPVSPVDEFAALRLFLSGPGRKWWQVPAVIAVAIGTFASLYHLYVPIVGAYDTFILRPLHLLLIGLVGLLVFDIRGRKRDFSKPSWFWLIDLALGAAFVLALALILNDPAGLEERFAYSEATIWDTIGAVILVTMVIELSRRCIGLPIAILILIILAYGIWGGDSFSIFRHRPIPTTEVFQGLYMTTFGIFGSPVAAMATYVFLFIIFGAYIEKCKTGLLIQRLGLKATGSSPGGPAKVAVVTSASFGTISGSALANVMATGAVTIPLMKRIGFRSEDAGGIEAAASSGGQLTPPIMGAVAFVMADITGIPYADIIVAAAVPALLFYISLFVAIDLTARRDNMQGVPAEMMPKHGEIMQLAHMVLPIVTLVVALISGYSPMMSALVGIATAIVVSSLRAETRLSLPEILGCLHTAAKTTVVATIACAAAGIVVGILNMTGFGLRLSSELINITNGQLLLALIFVMFTCVVLGMGMPTVAAYIITIAIGGPVLIELGVPVLAAHMFILYFAVLSLITPPVMVASFGAAALAEGSVTGTGLAAIRFAALAFVIPFVFVFNPDLLIIGSGLPWHAIALSIATATGGAVLFGVAISGYPARTLVERAIYIAAAYCLVEPGHGLDMIGIALVAAHLSTRWILTKRLQTK
ncbi:MAG: TRAP transporter fused permease subunit [Rhodospirillales bacterium]